MQPAACAQRPDRIALQRLSTPERIDRIRAARAARNAELDRRLDATETFYALLDQEQKALFDAVGWRFAARAGMGGGRGAHDRFQPGG